MSTYKGTMKGTMSSDTVLQLSHKALLISRNQCSQDHVLLGQSETTAIYVCLLNLLY